MTDCTLSTQIHRLKLPTIEPPFARHSRARAVCPACTPPGQCSDCTSPHPTRSTPPPLHPPPTNVPQTPTPPYTTPPYPTLLSSIYSYAYLQTREKKHMQHALDYHNASLHKLQTKNGVFCSKKGVDAIDIILFAVIVFGNDWMLDVTCLSNAMERILLVGTHVKQTVSIFRYQPIYFVGNIFRVSYDHISVFGKKGTQNGIHVAVFVKEQLFKIETWGRCCLNRHLFQTCWVLAMLIFMFFPVHPCLLDDGGNKCREIYPRQGRTRTSSR